MAALTRELVEKMGFCSLGENVNISDKASFYGAARISLGNNVRIDDYCTLSAGDGGINIGNYVHISVYASLIGAEKITLSDFSGLSARVSIYSSSDDYSGSFMTNPTVPNIYTGAKHLQVRIGKHVIVGSGCVILPGVTLEDGVAVGALSLVTKSCKEFGIYAGNPARRIAERKRDLLVLEQQLIVCKVTTG
ncbi:acyltransferase [Candidatus Aalborgicola defluviihabitans]|uniref:acyltransferase n=1 Tax=Candidatus Aalborgicola defluviihabitans TaxID=3386187 RepID=UPI001D247384|nr:acyltransferase [Burkholderiales bacterium]MBK7313073.1 acyltransferase [Burkholderiales bacterium]MBL0243732.1 acyltransferase [Rhodoferax sp.]